MMTNVLLVMALAALLVIFWWNRCGPGASAEAEVEYLDLSVVVILKSEQGDVISTFDIALEPHEIESMANRNDEELEDEAASYGLYAAYSNLHSITPHSRVVVHLPFGEAAYQFSPDFEEGHLVGLIDYKPLDFAEQAR